jgi:hypothetical protein
MSIGFPAYHIQRFNFRCSNLKVCVKAALRQTNWNWNDETTFTEKSKFKPLITAKSGITIWSFGETIQITFIDKNTIEIQSKCNFPTQMFDWGKNEKNVHTLVDLIEIKCNSSDSKLDKKDDTMLQSLYQTLPPSAPPSYAISEEKTQESHSDENVLESVKASEVEESSMGELEKLIERRNAGEITSEDFEEAKKEILERKPQINKEPVEVAQEEADAPIKKGKDSVVNKSNIGAGSSKMQELKDLTEMKEKGLIDDGEFKQMKKEILGK